VNAAQRTERPPRLQIGTRVRLRGASGLGTVFAVPYVFRGIRRAGVTWDSAPKWLATVDVSSLILVKTEPVGVPPEARPVSVGALQHPMRGGR
jgi:hypothetical protein